MRCCELSLVDYFHTIDLYISLAYVSITNKTYCNDKLIPLKHFKLFILD